MVLGKLPVPGRPTVWITVGQGPSALAVGAGGGCLDICTLIYPFSPLSPSLWETARYRLKYCLKGPLNPNQPTNHTDYPETTKATDNNKRSWNQQTRIGCKYLSGNNLQRIKLIRYKLFRDRYLLPMTAY